MSGHMHDSDLNEPLVKRDEDEDVGLMQEVSQLKTATYVSLLLMFIEIVGGYFANSLAIITDAMHLLSDVGGFIISVFTLKLMMQKPDAKHSFGFQQVGVLGALFSVSTIWAMAGVLFVTGIQRLLAPEPIDGKLMSIIATMGFVANVLMMAILGHDHGGAGCDHGHSHGGGGHGDHGGHGGDEGHGGHGGHEEHGGHEAHSGHSTHEAHEAHGGHEGHVEHGGHDGSHSTHEAHEAHEAHGGHEGHGGHDGHGGQDGGHQHGGHEEHGGHGGHAEHGGHGGQEEHGGHGGHTDQRDVEAGSCGGHGGHAEHGGHDTHEAHGGHGGHDDHAEPSVGRSLAMQAALIHVIGDMVQSIGVMLAGLGIWFQPWDLGTTAIQVPHPNSTEINATDVMIISNWCYADPICTILFTILVIGTTIGTVKQVINQILMSYPPNIDAKQLKKKLMAVEGVQSMHDLHVWMVGQGVFLTAHVEVERKDQQSRALNELVQVVQKMGVGHATFQVEVRGAFDRTSERLLIGAHSCDEA